MLPIQRHRGFTLLELLAALAVGTLMLVGLTSVLDISLQDARGQQTALHQAQFTAAATRYLTDNYATLLTRTAGGATVGIALADLNATGAGYLPASFAAQNAYRQTPCMLVRSPAANQLDALVVTEGGDAIAVGELGYISANAGTGGGAIGPATPNDGLPPVARGAFGSWMLDNAGLTNFTKTSCSGAAAGAGHLASAVFYGGASQLDADFLYRSAVSGKPELTQMNAPLGMGAGAMAVAGTACGTRAAIAIDASRQLLSCDATGIWIDSTDTSLWKAPVATFSELALLHASDPAGTVRVAADTARAYIHDGASTWTALAVDELGNLHMEGHLRADGNITAGVDVTAGRDVSALRDSIATNDMRASGVFAQDAAGSRSFSIYGRFTVGDRCNYVAPDRRGNMVLNLDIGTLAADASGITLMCQPDSTGSEGHFVYMDNTFAPPRPARRCRHQRHRNRDAPPCTHCHPSAALALPPSCLACLPRPCCVPRRRARAGRRPGCATASIRPCCTRLPAPNRA
ncbi:prepilin-type N-terminal cleavage/methylation domain-containing protein [Actimicrobium sp. GrIS 1.19]|uniref:shufflon system plasmid conjugative transfer pilus tip adhesin PilV n=1 Tax=Actimicrobium sp. GrIS 1.19 TaxID=3071708 RepID=UPI002E07E2C6|nr:prepilin-type N-terminal cleavage/methylation domain-containing protein [Actimicrobium sp. GrIS 1.19]